jgi:hypothetical protein
MKQLVVLCQNMKYAQIVMQAPQLLQMTLIVLLKVRQSPLLPLIRSHDPHCLIDCFAASSDKHSPHVRYYSSEIIYQFFQHHNFMKHPLSQELYNGILGSFDGTVQLELQNLMFFFSGIFNFEGYVAKLQQQVNQSGLPHQTPDKKNLLLNGGVATSPLATAPIHDVLLQKR